METLIKFTAAIFFTLGLMAQSAMAQTEPPSTQGSTPDTIHVAPPTGVTSADRASILAALEQVRPGGTVQFAPGMYVVGELIRVEVSGVMLLGHPEGTTLRGCHPADFVDMDVALFACNGLELAGGHQTVRNLTFEYAWHGLFIGCCFPSDMEAMEAIEAGHLPEPSQPGGHLIEGNTFLYSPNGMRVIGESSEPSVIRGNTFVNVYHAIGINGGKAHFLDNHIYVTEPDRVPISAHPGGAINITPFAQTADDTSCADNVIAGNRVEGHPEAIGIWAEPGTSCRNNVIRDNTIVVERVGFASPWMGIRFRNEADSSVVGVPLTLYSRAVDSGPGVEAGQPPGNLEKNLIERNRIIGAEGLGIEVMGASRNQIVNNTITGIKPRDPFPGNTLGHLPEWDKANGAGIWVSPGSDGNEIIGNKFEDIASHAVVLEGDSNRVETRNESDVVHDLGSGNRVSGPDQRR